MSTTDLASVTSTFASDLEDGVDALLNIEYFCGVNVGKGEFGVGGSGGGVVCGGGGTKSLTASSTVEQLEAPKAPGNLHGGTDRALFVPKPPESMRSQSVLLSGVNVTLTRDGDEATLSSDVPL